MRLTLIGILILILASSASAVIKEDSSILLINNPETEFFQLDYKDGNFVSKTLQQTKFPDWEDLTLADIDGNGFNELIALRDIGIDVYVYGIIDQEFIEKYDPRSIGSFAKDLDWVRVVPVNFDKDKADELLLLNNRYGRFYLIDKNDGAFTVSMIGSSHNVLYNDWISMDVGDVDNDKVDEIVLLRKNDQPIYILEYNQGEITPVEDAKKIGDFIEGIDVSSLSVGDLNNDGKDEIIVTSSEDGKIYSVSYSNTVNILTQTSYRKILDSDIVDIDQDGKNELVLLKQEKNPISTFKFVGEALVEKVVTSFNGEVGWVGIATGKFVNQVEEAPVQEPIVQEPVEQKPIDTDLDGVNDDINNCVNNYNPNQEDSDSNKIGNACDVAVKEKSSAPIYILFFIIIIAAAVIAYLLYKYKFKSDEDEEEKEEKESMWPVSKSSKDLKDMKELLKLKKAKSK